jgi:hypothetical protein
MKSVKKEKPYTDYYVWMDERIGRGGKAASAQQLGNDRKGKHKYNPSSSSCPCFVFSLDSLPSKRKVKKGKIFPSKRIPETVLSHRKLGFKFG